MPDILRRGGNGLTNQQASICLRPLENLAFVMSWMDLPGLFFYFFFKNLLTTSLSCRSSSSQRCIRLDEIHPDSRNSNYKTKIFFTLFLFLVIFHLINCYFNLSSIDFENRRIKIQWFFDFDRFSTLSSSSFVCSYYVRRWFSLHAEQHIRYLE